MYVNVREWEACWQEYCSFGVCWSHSSPNFPFSAHCPRCLCAAISTGGAAELSPSFLPRSSLGAGISWIRFPDSQAPGSHLPAAVLSPRGDIHTEKRPPICLCDPLLGSQCPGVGLLPGPEPGTLVSLGHGKAWALGPSQEVSLASSLRHCPKGQTSSSCSLALQRSGLAGGRERAQLGRRAGAPGSLYCWEQPRSSL